MLRWYWYLCGSVYAKQTRLLQVHQDEDYETDAALLRALADRWSRSTERSKSQRARPRIRSSV